LDPEDEFTKVIIDYAKKVLVATGLHNGAANTEVKFLEEENQPCLVEINARWAGINWHDGLAVEKATVGLDQYTATFDAYLDAGAFERMPDVRPMIQHGAVVFGVNYRAGILRGIPGLSVAKNSQSYLDSDVVGVSVGKVIPKTTPNTIPCNIALAHKDKAVVDADYYHLIHLEKEGEFFDIAPSTGGASRSRPLLTALHADHSGLPARPLLSLASLAILLGVGAGAVAIFVKTVLRRDSAEGAVYLAIE